MIYEYDEQKNIQNIKKHGIHFEEAITVFNDPDFQMAHDRFVAGEERFLALGYSNKGKTLLVVHCYRKRHEKEITRIISARKLTKKEEKSLGKL